MNFSANKRRRARVSYLAIAAVVLHAVLYVLHVPAMAAAAVDAGAPGTTTIVICSAHGLKRITIDAEGNRVDEKEPAGNQNDGLTCTTCCTATVALPAAAGAPWLAAPSDALALPRLRHLIESRYVRSLRSRGPPFPA